MDKGYFPLGDEEESRVVKLIKVAFGITCILMALYWVYYNLKILKVAGTLWISIIFLASFGLYLILSGLGMTFRYIIIGSTIKIKKSAIGHPVVLSSSEIDRIEIFPLSIVFILNSGKKFLLRFGTVHNETNEKIVDEIVKFAETYNIEFEIKEENI
jgi:uncharacterized protein YlzI (FlbEa/FlbD family)